MTVKIESLDSTEESSQNHGYLAEDESNLDNDWIEVIADLKETKEGQKITDKPRFKEYVKSSSKYMREIAQFVEANGGLPKGISKAELEEIYETHPPVVSFAGRVAVIAAIESGIKDLYPTLEEDSVKKRLVQRWHSSVLEEYSMVADESVAAEYARSALELSEEVANSIELEINNSPRKIHAIFTPYNIGLRSLLYGPHLQPEHQEFANLPLATINRTIEIIQRELYKDLVKITEDLSEDANHDKYCITGAIGDICSLAWLRDANLKRGLIKRLEFCEGTLRHDQTPRSGKIPAKKRKTTISEYPTYSTSQPKLSSDNLCIDHLRNRTRLIEVKKLTKGSSLNGKPSKYLPGILMINLRLPAENNGLNTINNYSKARIKEINDELLTEDELEILKIPEIGYDIYENPDKPRPNGYAYPTPNQIIDQILS
jgi:hypothetical protein